MQYELDLTRATGADETQADTASKLSRIVQLTGTVAMRNVCAPARALGLRAAAGKAGRRDAGNSDTVYAEAYVNVHQYDILLGTSAPKKKRGRHHARPPRVPLRLPPRPPSVPLTIGPTLFLDSYSLRADVLIVNQTNDTLQNLALELATLGDLKLVERPSSHTLGPRDFLNIKANLKVSSTDTGAIFGNIVYDTTAHAETNVVVLNDIHIDIMDYIHPATCTETEVRREMARGRGPG